MDITDSRSAQGPMKSTNDTEILCQSNNYDTTQLNCTSEKQSAAWTANATYLLLKFYDSELGSLETAKKKKKIWIAISEKLKQNNITVTPDQVRWKINALTKKYKRCIESGSNCKFKYYKAMDQIYTTHNLTDYYKYTISELLDNKTNILKYESNTSSKTESKAIIELRKMRLANRLESDRAQTKIQIERQWLEYLNRRENIMQQRDQFIDKELKLKEQKIKLKKRELELTQSLEYQNINLIENTITNILQTEREKVDVLKQILSKRDT